MDSRPASLDLREVSPAPTGPAADGVDPSATILALDGYVDSEPRTGGERSRADRGPQTAVLIPCRNEAATIATVVAAFRRVLPAAAVYVYDNGSCDGTAELADAAGAIVRRAPVVGKGNVVRRMFADVDADVYVLADGDDTYEIDAAPRLVRMLCDERLDMVVGRRVEDSASAFPRGHRVGNRSVSAIVRRLFGASCRDVLSGYRVLSRRYVKSFPALSRGFETEVEMTVHALELGLAYAETDTAYRERPAASASKLRTIPDGIRIGGLILRLWKEYQPLRLFGGLAVLSGLAALTVWAWAAWWAASLGLYLLAMVAVTTGLIVDTVSRRSRELKRVLYLSATASLPAANPQGTTDTTVDLTA